jgi:F-type H+-transporting ATPase subunit delta
MTNRSAALRYARALLEVGIKERADLEGIERELAAFAGLMTEHPTLGKVLLNPAVSAPRKKAVVAEIVARMQTIPIVSKLLTLLAERDRLVLLPDLLASYRDRLLEYRHVVRAEVTTATPLAEGQAAEIQQRLGSATGRTVTLQTRTDPSIIGGVVARIGSTVYDGSVTRQLQRMKSRLAEGAGS